MMMMYWGSGISWWAAIVMWVGMLAFWGLIIWAVYFLVTGAVGRNETRPTHDARHILDTRLARGEIDLDEYHRLRGAMTDHDRSAGVGAGSPR